MKVTVTSQVNGVDQGYVEDSSGNQIYPSTSGNDDARPLVWALARTGDANVFNQPPIHFNCLNQPTWGRVIKLRAGSYAGDIKMRGDATASDTQIVGCLGGTLTEPVVVIGGPGVVIKHVPASAYDVTDTILVEGVDSNHTLHNITWKNITFETSTRSAISIGSIGNTYSGDDVITGYHPVTYDNWRFENCVIKGLYDHETDTGIDLDKFGVSAWSLRNFVWDGGSVSDIRRNQGFYLRNCAGDLSILNTEIYEVGGPAIQIVARYEEMEHPVPLPTNPGNILIQGCHIADTCLFTPNDNPNLPDGDCINNPYCIDYGNYHNGQAITISGGNTGNITISDNLIEFGHDSFTTGLRAAILAREDFEDNTHFGQGAVLLWVTGNTAPNGSLDRCRISGDAILERNLISYFQDAGNLPPVTLSAVDSACMSDNVIETGWREDAIWLGNPDFSDCDLRLGGNDVPDLYQIKGNNVLRRWDGNGYGLDAYIRVDDAALPGQYSSIRNAIICP